MQNIIKKEYEPQYNRRINTWNQFETNFPWKKT